MTEKPELVGVREFREKLSSFREPVKVVHTRGSLKVLGVWIPEGYEEPKPEKKPRG